MHQHEVRGGIDVDALAVDALQHEGAAGAGHQPDLVAVAPGAGAGCDRAEGTDGDRFGGIQKVLAGDDLLAVAGTVVREQQGKARIVADGGVEAAKSGSLTGGVDAPGRVGLGAHGLPDLGLQQIR